MTVRRFPGTVLAAAAVVAGLVLSGGALLWGPVEAASAKATVARTGARCTKIGASAATTKGVALKCEKRGATAIWVAAGSQFTDEGNRLAASSLRVVPGFTYEQPSAAFERSLRQTVVEALGPAKTYVRGYATAVLHDGKGIEFLVQSLAFRSDFKSIATLDILAGTGSTALVPDGSAVKTADSVLLAFGDNVVFVTLLDRVDMAPLVAYASVLRVANGLPALR